jgi:hypothetical protein
MPKQASNGRYDFFILQSSTAGGYALNEFLRAHPEIHLPDREAVDHLFERGQEQCLCQTGTNPVLVPAWPNNYRLGFLLHSRIQIEAGIPGRVAALCKRDATLFQLVRDPVKVISASHKRYLQINIFREVARQLGMPGYEQDVPIRTPKEVYEWLQPRLFYHAQALRFAEDFADYWIIDASEVWPDKVDSTMQQLYARIGVDGGFKSELFHKDFHGFLQRMFEFSRMNVTLYGYEIPVRLEIAANVAFARDGFSSTVAQADQEIGLLGGGREKVRLALVTDTLKWGALPEKLRTYLGEGDDLQAFLEHELLPGWNGLYQHVKGFIEERWISDLPPALVGRIHDDLAGDYRQLFRIRPDLEALWGWGTSTGFCRQDCVGA